MQAFPGALRLAGQLMILNGILHCLAWIVSGWSGDTMQLIPYGLVYIALGAGLVYRIRTIRYLAFIVTLVGVLAAYISVGSTAVAVWAMWVFIVIDLVVLAILIASIWRGRQPV